jgi:dipeptidyl aminopeptidase/acylaminoacyl peptidase
MILRLSLVVGLGLATPGIAVAAEAKAGPTAEVTLDAMRASLDAARARIRAQEAQYHDPMGAHRWIDGARLWYVETARDGARRWWLADASKAPGVARTPLFDHAAAAAALAGEGRPAPAADRLPVRAVVVEDGRVVVSVEGREEPLVFDLAGGPPREGDAADLRLFELRLSARRARSRGQGASSALDFVNQLDEPVEILWINARGEARSYGVVPPGATREQHTFGGHAWLVRRTGGEELGTVVAADVRKSVVIDGTTREEDTDERPAGRSDGWRRARADAPTPDTEGIAAMPAHVIPDYQVVRDGSALVFRQEGREFLRTPADESFDPHWVSPDRAAVLAFAVQRRVEPRSVHIVEASPKDQLQPKLRTLGYVKPGDEIDVVIPKLFRVEPDAAGALAAREIPLDRTLYATPWSIDRVRFLPGGREVAFLYNQRGHQVVRVVALDLVTGAARTVAEQSYPTFVDYTNKVWMHWLDGTGELLWMTERSGYNHIELIDVRAGVVKHGVTDGSWNVRRVLHVDEGARTIDIALMGRDPMQDPYHVHDARVAIDSGALTMLTDGDGTCRVDFSPDRSALVSVRARADAPPVHELRRSSDGVVVAELARADDSAMRTAGWIAPERFVAKGRDGATDIWGLVYRPSGFDPARSYPVIENIYAGPHDQHVSKWFDLGGRSREYAELGAIVVEIDGMGTNWRGKAFHDVCWKNLKDAGFPDRIAWLKALATRDASVDLSRVTIFGGSAGGQNAMRAVIDHADMYKAAVADCGCHDNRMDKIWWNEQWMGWPVDESYALNSNMEDAHRLAGKLMLVVGGLDENVDPASTMQVAQKLIDAGKDFELLVIPDAGHGAAESEYGNVRRARFLFAALD